MDSVPRRRPLHQFGFWHICFDTKSVTGMDQMVIVSGNKNDLRIGLLGEGGHRVLRTFGMWEEILRKRSGLT